MITKQLSMTAPQPSFGMPVLGSASAALACPATVAEARLRHADGFARVTADVVKAAVANDAIWGTNAWRPPTC